MYDSKNNTGGYEDRIGINDPRDTLIQIVLSGVLGLGAFLAFCVSHCLHYLGLGEAYGHIDIATKMAWAVCGSEAPKGRGLFPAGDA